MSVRFDPVALTLTETLTDLDTRATYSNTFTGVDIQAAIGSSSGFVGFTGGTGGAIAAQSISNFSFSNSAQGVVLEKQCSDSCRSLVHVDGGKPVSAGGAGTAMLAGTLALAAGATLKCADGGATATDSPYTLNVLSPTNITGSTTINVANNGTGAGRAVLGDLEILRRRRPSPKQAPDLGAFGSSFVHRCNDSECGFAHCEWLDCWQHDREYGRYTGGTGTMAAVSVANGGIVAPGNSIGTLSTGPLSLQNGSAYKLEIGAATADQLKVNGAGTLAGTINLAISLLADPVDDTMFTILDGSSALVGFSTGARFSYLGAPLGQNQQFTVTDGGFTQTFTINYSSRFRVVISPWLPFRSQVRSVPCSSGRQRWLAASAGANSGLHRAGIEPLLLEGVRAVSTVRTGCAVFRARSKRASAPLTSRCSRKSAGSPRRNPQCRGARGPSGRRGTLQSPPTSGG